MDQTVISLDKGYRGLRHQVTMTIAIDFGLEATRAGRHEVSFAAEEAEMRGDHTTDTSLLFGWGTPNVGVSLPVVAGPITTEERWWVALPGQPWGVAA
jgi:hypothetical protein